MDFELIRQNLRARDVGPKPMHPCAVWGHGDFLHVCFSSVGCRFREAGHCTMCDYGGDRNLSAQEAVAGLEQAMAQVAGPVRELLLGTCGSILDQREMPLCVLEAVLRAVCAHPVPTIILETHYTTVTDTVLERIHSLLPDRELVIEMGFESADPVVLEHSLGKYMDLAALDEAIKRIHSHGMSPVLNVFLGAPFLTPSQQLQDAECALAWGFRHCADRVVLFPANIKPNTLLWTLYQAGNYRRISHWMLVELLLRLDNAQLERVELSWYGDRQNAGQNLEIIPPECCPACKDLLAAFYQAFMEDFSPECRRNLLKKLTEEASCHCRESVLDSLSVGEG